MMVTFNVYKRKICLFSYWTKVLNSLETLSSLFWVFLETAA